MQKSKFERAVRVITRKGLEKPGVAVVDTEIHLGRKLRRRMRDVNSYELCGRKRCTQLGQKGLIRLHNADPMIGELVVGARQFDLRHVARDTVVSRHPTGFGSDLSTAMAGLALCIIVSRLCAEFCMRVVAGQTTDARVVGVVA